MKITALCDYNIQISSNVRPTPTPGCVRLGMTESFDAQHNYIWAKDNTLPNN